MPITLVVAQPNPSLKQKAIFDRLISASLLLHKSSLALALVVSKQKNCRDRLSATNTTSHYLITITDKNISTAVTMSSPKITYGASRPSSQASSVSGSSACYADTRNGRSTSWAPCPVSLDRSANKIVPGSSQSSVGSTGSASARSPVVVHNAKGPSYDVKRTQQLSGKTWA